MLAWSVEPQQFFRGVSSKETPNNCCVNSTVIASAAKQSRGHSTRPLDCFVARAPRNDGRWRCSRCPHCNCLSNRPWRGGSAVDAETLDRVGDGFAWDQSLVLQA